MLSYSVINLKLLQNIVFKLSDKRKCLLFFFLLDRARRGIQPDFCPEEAVSCRQCLSVCFFRPKGRAKSQVFSTMWNNFLRGKLLFMSAASRWTVRPVCYSWLKKEVTMLATCWSSGSPHIRSYQLFYIQEHNCCGQVTLSSEGKGVHPVEGECRILSFSA